MDGAAKSRRYTPLRLYRRRHKEHLREQWKNLKLVIDWTVWLYLLIPGLLYLIGWYVSLWSKPLPLWASNTPLTLLTLIIEIVMLTGGVLLFVEEADVLFLKSQKRWMQTLMRQGMYRACTLHIGKMLIVTALTAPLWYRVYDMSVAEILLLSIWFGTVASLQVIALHMIKVRYNGWRRGIRLVPLTVAMGIIFITVTSSIYAQISALFIALGCTIFLIILLGRIRLQMQGTFEGDVREDLRAKVKLTVILISQAVNKPKAPRTKTMIFRKPRKLLRNRTIANRTAETAYKAFFRESSTLKLYFQMGSLSIAAVALPPFPVNVIVCGLLIIMLTVMFYRSWDHFATSDYVQLVSYDSDALHRAGLMMVRMLFVPIGILMGVALGLTWLGWMASILVAVGVVASGLFVLSVAGWIRLTRSN
ncbi:ABC transporter permease [Paenibacillus tundrae]